MSNRYRAAFRNTLKTIFSSKKYGSNRSSLYYYNSNNTKISRVNDGYSLKKSKSVFKNVMN